MTQPIIPPVEKGLLLEELSRAREIKDAAHGSIKVYCIDSSFPSLLREMGRLREIAFRVGGAGTGKDVDIDDFDTDPSLGFRQLFAWDTEEEAIVGGYRFVYGYNIRFGDDGQPIIPSAHMYRFSDRFIREELPHTMELSRSFIVERYQRNSGEARKSIFILDCLFKAICAEARDGKMTDIFGKVTFYPNYPAEAFALVTAAMEKHCYGGDDITPIKPYVIQPSEEAMQVLIHNDFRSDFRALTATLLKRGQYLPPILKSYLNQTTTLKYYGTAVFEEFGHVVEIALKLHLPDLDRARWSVYFNNMDELQEMNQK